MGISQVCRLCRLRSTLKICGRTIKQAPFINTDSTDAFVTVGTDLFAFKIAYRFRKTNRLRTTIWSPYDNRTNSWWPVYGQALEANSWRSTWGKFELLAEKENVRNPTKPKIPKHQLFLPKMVNNGTMKRHSNKNQLVNYVSSVILSASDSADDTRTEEQYRQQWIRQVKDKKNSWPQPIREE